MPEPAEKDSVSRPNSKLRFRAVAKRTVRITVYMAAAWLVTIVLGLIPVNNDFAEPTAEGVTIHVLTNPVHADSVVPVKHQVIDWMTVIPTEYFPGNVADATHVAFGWGDRAFYLNTPTWGDLTWTTTLNALLLPSQCCLHVQFLKYDQAPLDLATVTISDEQYRSLVGALLATGISQDAKFPAPIPNYAYNNWDRFFEAKGRYHMFNTCNSWVGSCLRKSGVRAPISSPLPHSPTLYFPP